MHNDLNIMFQFNNESILVSIGTESSSFIVLCAVHICTVVECTILALNRLPTLLVRKMPVETCEWPMLRAFVLQKLRALLCSKLIQISTRKCHTARLLKVLKV